LLRLSSVDGDEHPGVSGRSGPDGGFALGAEEGQYELSAERLGRVRVVRRLSVGPDGLADVRIEMGRGRSIVGRVVGPSGRPARGQMVFASGADGFERTLVRDDGSFRIEGLATGPYALSVGSPLAGFATRRAVQPGPEVVRLTLRPTGMVVLRVVSDDGRPVADAVPSITSVDGATIESRAWDAPPTGEEGLTKLRCPAGVVDIGVRHPWGTGVGTLDVPSGETVSLEIAISPGPAEE
jgi:hypothetical protein